MNEIQVDCIVRFHDAKRLYELNRCVFSLVGQTYRPLNIILAVQRFSAAELAATHAALDPMLSLSNAPTLTIENWESSTPSDARTELLNLGLARATGRYVAFLDYDDVLYPEAYATLVERIRLTGAAIAFASVRIVNADVFPQFIQITRQVEATFHGENLHDLFKSNFCPIHSYLIDRVHVSKDILFFDTRLTWEEDYDSLLRICAAYPSDFKAKKKLLGDYYYKSDGSNTVPTSGILSAFRLAEYDRVTALIEVRRKTTLVAPAVQIALGFAEPHPGMTIRGALNVLNCGFRST